MARMSEREQAELDARLAIERASLRMNGLDENIAMRAIEDGLKAIAAQLTALANTKYVSREEACETCGRSAIPFERIAKATTQTVRGLDDLYRLVAFAKGQPDSRPAGSLSEMLSYLSDEESKQVQGIFASAMARQRG
jgi:hypothetical protein